MSSNTYIYPPLGHDDLITPNSHSELFIEFDYYISLPIIMIRMAKQMCVTVCVFNVYRLSFEIQKQLLLCVVCVFHRMDRNYFSRSMSW